MILVNSNNQVVLSHESLQKVTKEEKDFVLIGSPTLFFDGLLPWDEGYQIVDVNPPSLGKRYNYVDGEFIDFK